MISTFARRKIREICRFSEYKLSRIDYCDNFRVVTLCGIFFGKFLEIAMELCRTISTYWLVIVWSGVWAISLFRIGLDQILVVDFRLPLFLLFFFLPLLLELQMPHVVECGSQDTIFNTVVVPLFWMFLKVEKHFIQNVCGWVFEISDSTLSNIISLINSLYFNMWKTSFCKASPRKRHNFFNVLLRWSSAIMVLNINRRNVEK